MKYSTLLVGGGVIARHYKTGLDRSATLRLDALVDVNANCAARSCYSVPFYTNLNKALALHPQIALLALPVSARGEVARKLLAKGVAVFTEKPMFENLGEIQSLSNFAVQCGTPLACMFHWKAADEVRFLKNNLSRFGKIRKISATVHDDYAATPDGTIRPDRVSLMGAWIDSGINILSYYDELFDLSAAAVLEETLLPDPASSLPIYARKRFEASGVEAEITVDWRTPSREKTSVIECDYGTLVVNHSKQTVQCGGETIFSSPAADRLSSHYENLFADLSPESLSKSQQSTLLLHKILYTGNAK